MDSTDRKRGYCDSATMSSQHLSGIHSLGFLLDGFDVERATTLQEHPHEIGRERLAETRILLVSINANVSLWRSKRPR